VGEGRGERGEGRGGRGERKREAPLMLRYRLLDAGKFLP
jgi:hypothetical protein